MYSNPRRWHAGRIDDPRRLLLEPKDPPTRADRKTEGARVVRFSVDLHTGTFWAGAEEFGKLSLIAHVPALGWWTPVLHVVFEGPPALSRAESPPPAASVAVAAILPAASATSAVTSATVEALAAGMAAPPVPPSATATGSTATGATGATVAAAALQTGKRDPPAIVCLFPLALPLSTMT